MSIFYSLNTQYMLTNKCINLGGFQTVSHRTLGFLHSHLMLCQVISDNVLFVSSHYKMTDVNCAYFLQTDVQVLSDSVLHSFNDLPNTNHSTTTSHNHQLNVSINVKIYKRLSNSLSHSLPLYHFLFI